MVVTLIAAMAENRVIGRAGRIPWDVPEDRRRFRQLTMGHTLIMGRLTFDSIGRPLAGRRTIVLSRQPGWTATGCETAGSLEAALLACRSEDEVFVCGGAQVYREALSSASRIWLTVIAGEPDGDVFFPPIPAYFVETGREELDPVTGKATCILLERRS